MTSLRFGLCVCVAGLLAATGCPAGDDTSEDTANDSEAMTTAPGDTSSGSAEESTGSGTTLSHAADIQPIWDAKCVDACHDPTGEWGFILDMSGDAYGVLVDQPASQLASMSYVTPGDPDASYLWHKIANTQASVGGSGLPMPKARMGMAADTMTQAELDMIEEWIAGGAPP